MMESCREHEVQHDVRAEKPQTSNSDSAFLQPHATPKSTKSANSTNSSPRLAFNLHYLAY